MRAEAQKVAAAAVKGAVVDVERAAASAKDVSDLQASLVRHQQAGAAKQEEIERLSAAMVITAMLSPSTARLATSQCGT